MNIVFKYIIIILIYFFIIFVKVSSYDIYSTIQIVLRVVMDIVLYFYSKHFNFFQ